ncbi:MAG: hypothetical protein ACHQ4H_08845 [Ktedonobacterales bacterium]
MSGRDHLADDQLDPHWQDVPTGTPVYGSDNTQLGTVTDRRDNGLIVTGKAPSNDTYVVTPQDIARVEPDGLWLLIGASEAMRDQTPDTTAPQPPAP